MGFILRWVFALLLLAATYNPTQFNYVRWAIGNLDTQLPMIVLAGLVLLVGYIVYLTATLRSIGAFGMLLILAIVAAILWVLWDRGVISLANPGFVTWIVILALSLVLAVGMHWSILWRRLSGQLEVDDNDP
ncbi:hypothetical protein JQU17_05200 [Ponticoccus sp. SC2-23]|uniref:DUF6524 family protein n=1 Tax=Alexandriicola marinus TaxID=2081710 RepID=UPI000FDA6EC1|nr:DUF6524 family protein [Alexandriicola marinus]MBM1219585.1 hypothetical protein [Ponticoccus sp. SC6-9]MBM1223343.1 hypothetical protein [Ponticoccus sp. SC6-15]MBM1229398.1 hypothetical protein [Ponticoccus sp. SC6-38]MBM1232309.1 hypothetical protein [Ponticoccus sp. SC6-45]MBM1237741.1 hypothetical protein [Ponticoccus sp. SC6-49]MBM1241320.1 hypothetical protein [Ponticoccus sp. SC2-64]MBM1245833.1 hypothetical protein [Ponticoccus sp. SC6-42]MBM1250311.1 hypothetical protein [Ponti